jgi:hypothetical protein
VSAEDLEEMLEGLLVTDTQPTAQEASAPPAEEENDEMMIEPSAPPPPGDEEEGGGGSSSTRTASFLAAAAPVVATTVTPLLPAPMRFSPPTGHSGFVRGTSMDRVAPSHAARGGESIQGQSMDSDSAVDAIPVAEANAMVVAEARRLLRRFGASAPTSASGGAVVAIRSNTSSSPPSVHGGGGLLAGSTSSSSSSSSGHNGGGGAAWAGEDQWRGQREIKLTCGYFPCCLCYWLARKGVSDVESYVLTNRALEIKVGWAVVVGVK